MNDSLMLELHIFLTSIYGGIIVGLVYDLYKSLRYLSKPSKIITYIGDFLFWIIMSYIFFYTLVKINWGEIRGYILFGFFLGIIIYMIVFSKYIYPIFVKMTALIKKSVVFTTSSILYPFKYLKKRSFKTVNKIKKIPIEIVRDIKKYKKIIYTKK